MNEMKSHFYATLKWNFFDHSFESKYCDAISSCIVKECLWKSRFKEKILLEKKLQNVFLELKGEKNLVIITFWRRGRN